MGIRVIFLRVRNPKNPRSSERGFFIQADRLGISPTPFGRCISLPNKVRRISSHPQGVYKRNCWLDDIQPFRADYCKAPALICFLKLFTFLKKQCILTNATQLNSMNFGRSVFILVKTQLFLAFSRSSSKLCRSNRSYAFFSVCNFVCTHFFNFGGL